MAQNPVQLPMDHSTPTLRGIPKRSFAPIELELPLQKSKPNISLPCWGQRVLDKDDKRSSNKIPIQSKLVSHKLGLRSGNRPKPVVWHSVRVQNCIAKKWALFLHFLHRPVTCAHIRASETHLSYTMNKKSLSSCHVQIAFIPFFLVLRPILFQIISRVERETGQQRAIIWIGICYFSSSKLSASEDNHRTSCILQQLNMVLLL